MLLRSIKCLQPVRIGSTIVKLSLLGAPPGGDRSNVSLSALTPVAPYKHTLIKAHGNAVSELALW